MQNKKIPLHGNGKNVRHYISVNDFCRGLNFVIKKCNKGIYNIGSKEKFTNLEVAQKISQLFNKKNTIKFVKNRPFNDTRYSITSQKIKKLGWKTKDTLFKQLPIIIDWYKKNFKLFKI